MTKSNEEFKMDESIVQGFANFFKKKVEDIVAQTEIDRSIYNRKKKVDSAAENFFTEENVSKT